MSVRESPTSASTQQDDAVALVAEFADVESVMHAAEKMRDAAYTRWDVHTPFPVHGMDRAMGIRPTILPWITLAHGLAGLALGLLMVWWTNATTVPGVPTELQGYQYLTSGKPVFSFQANVAIVFELTVLFAAFGTVLGMLGLNKLPMLHNPLHRVPRFVRATSDRFFIVIEADDKYFSEGEARLFLQTLGATAIERVTEADE